MSDADATILPPATDRVAADPAAGISATVATPGTDVALAASPAAAVTPAAVVSNDAPAAVPSTAAATGDRRAPVAAPAWPAPDPADRADVAVKSLYRALLDTLLAHEPGVREDLDPEHLHDFRVAVRRTRSGLGQLKGVLPAAAAEPYRGELGWLGSVTGPKRDLDVLRLALPGLRERLPPAVRGDLDPLDAFLADHQAVEQARLVAALDGERYRALVDGWRGVLDDPAPAADDTPDAARPVGVVADERIWKAYRRVRKGGRAIGPASPPEALHALRIACKKLRYLVELFRPLYPARELRSVVGDLKRLQDNLGAFNDTAVQQAALAAYAERMQAEGRAPAATLMAMGRLACLLDADQAAERRRFARRFARFDRPADRARMRRLFKPTVARHRPHDDTQAPPPDGMPVDI